MNLITIELDGKKIAFSSETEFLVQIGRGKSAYKTSYRFKGNLVQAFRNYEAINIGRGYKKRLLMPNSKKPTLLRQTS